MAEDTRPAAGRSALVRTLRVISQMHASGVLGRYAIGGAVGAAFYVEPAATLDVDVFVSIPAVPGKLISTPQPIYDHLKALGYAPEGESIRVEGWLVQFLPPPTPLVEEGIASAKSFAVEDVRTFVFTAEHMVSIALQTGRPKDKARILQFLEADVLNRETLKEILSRHGLSERWKRFEKTFLGEP
jgi:hypothetical protein